MEHIHIALIDMEGKLRGKLGKKTNETDYIIYNLKQGEKVLCVYEPHRYPDKIQSLLGAINSADHIVFAPSKIDAEFAEVALALWLSDKKGTLILSDTLDESMLAPILSKSPLWGWKRMVTPSDTELREYLLTLPPGDESQKKAALVDACFSVGGVGTVALTKVLGGIFDVHDELVVVPGGHKTSIKSIQEQDVDVKSSTKKSRAGFSLKNIEPEKVRRGSYLAPAGEVRQIKQGEAEVSISPLVKELPAPGDIFMSWGLNFSISTIDGSLPQAGEVGKVKFRLPNELGCIGEQRFFLVRQNKRPRVVGSGKILE